MLNDLPPDTLPRLMRRTVLSALFVGLGGFVVALLVGSPAAAAGVVVGLGLAIVNLRFLDRQVARVPATTETSTKSLRRQLGSKTAVRMAVLTAIVAVAVLLSPAWGIGIVSGLVLYQIVFVANVYRVVAGQGGLK